MSLSGLRVELKKILPGPVRWLLRGLLHYAQRLRRWCLVVWQIQGCTVGNQFKLIISAMWGFIGSLWSLQQWRGPVSLFDLCVNVSGVGVFKVRAGTDDLWHVLPYREDVIFSALDKHLKPGNIFVDAGANIGVYTIYASQLVGDKGQVIAIEMMPENAAILSEHVAMNRCENVIIHQFALSDRVGDVVRATVPEGNYGQASIARKNENNTSKVSDVRTSTLDNLLSENGAIDVIKIDIEGAEMLALLGAHKVLPRTDVVIYESNSSDMSEREDIDNLILSYGFSIKALDGNNRVAVKSE